MEHRLIEKLVETLKTEVGKIRGQDVVNVVLMEQAVDFFRTYSDRTPDHKRIMAELIE